MKSISEIYNNIKEDSSISTPNNTLGMGNPIPAGINGNEGSEPIPTKKKKKNKPYIKEGVLAGYEKTMSNNDDVIKRINVANEFLSVIISSSKKPNYNSYEEFVLDVSKCFEVHKDNTFDIYLNRINNKLIFDYLTNFEIIDTKSNIWKQLKQIYNCGYKGLIISSNDGNLKELNLTIWKDDGKTFGDIAILTKPNVKNIYIGNLICDQFIINSRCRIETILVGADSYILQPKLFSETIKEIYGPLFSNAYNTYLSYKTIENLLKYNKIIPFDCNLTIR